MLKQSSFAQFRGSCLYNFGTTEAENKTRRSSFIFLCASLQGLSKTLSSTFPSLTQTKLQQFIYILHVYEDKLQML